MLVGCYACSAFILGSFLAGDQESQEARRLWHFCLDLDDPELQAALGTTGSALYNSEQGQGRTVWQVVNSDEGRFYSTDVLPGYDGPITPTIFRLVL